MYRRAEASSVECTRISSTFISPSNCAIKRQKSNHSLVHWWMTEVCCTDPRDLPGPRTPRSNMVTVHSLRGEGWVILICVADIKFGCFLAIIVRIGSSTATASSPMCGISLGMLLRFKQEFFFVGILKRTIEIFCSVSAAHFF